MSAERRLCTEEHAGNRRCWSVHNEPSGICCVVSQVVCQGLLTGPRRAAAAAVIDGVRVVALAPV